MSNYVIVWREDGSRRLRTYTASDGSPISSPLGNIFPEPSVVVDTSDDLNVWLNSPPDEQAIAVSAELARSELGWEPSLTEHTREDDSFT